MDGFNRKDHWEKVYRTKAAEEVSWYQPVPETSLGFLHRFAIPKTAAIIDVGGGDGFFADHLLELGYRNITVLDISSRALERARERLGEKAKLVNWIVSDAATFEPEQQYDFWHDRAAFHFLTEEAEIESYTKALAKGITAGGILVLGTFSEEGPAKCSGIPVKQYSEQSMTERLSALFDKEECHTVDHQTPFDTVQRFIFCGFRKK